MTRACEPFVYHTLRDIFFSSKTNCLNCCRRKQVKARKLVDVKNSLIGPNAEPEALKMMSSKKKKKIMKKNQINAFVNKAINVEYVFLILTGIIKIMTV